MTYSIFILQVKEKSVSAQILMSLSPIMSYQLENLPIITADPQIATYPVEVIW
jgi:hypothetical protein